MALLMDVTEVTVARRGHARLPDHLALDHLALLADVILALVIALVVTRVVAPVQQIVVRPVALPLLVHLEPRRRVRREEWVLDGREEDRLEVGPAFQVPIQPRERAVARYRTVKRPAPAPRPAPTP